MCATHSAAGHASGQRAHAGQASSGVQPVQTCNQPRIGAAVSCTAATQSTHPWHILRPTCEVAGAVRAPFLVGMVLGLQQQRVGCGVARRCPIQCNSKFSNL